MASMKRIQAGVGREFRNAFGKTPLRQRIDDIVKEAHELQNWGSIYDLKSEFGDLLASVLAGIDECGWDAEQLIEENHAKIVSRLQQYKSLGRKTQVAILGGAFDPITKGHIAVANFVLKTSGVFDEVWLCPCYSHMNNKDMASPEDRVAMIKKAIKEHPQLKLLTYEIDHQLAGETYHFCKRLLDDDLSETHNFSLIIGMDNANSFDKWVNFEELERMMRFVIVPRAGQRPDPNVNWYLNGRHIYLRPDASHPIPETSSTAVRAGIADGTKWGHLVDPWVGDYIRANGLYGHKKYERS